MSEKDTNGDNPSFLLSLINTPVNFVAGKTSVAFEKWAQLTSDKCALAGSQEFILTSLSS